MKKLLCFICAIMLIQMLCSCVENEDGISASEEKKYVGSINSDVYHYSDCRCK